MAKKKKQEEAPVEVKPVVFTGATLRDGFCDYNMTIKQGAGVGNHTVKGEGLFKPDMHNAFVKLNVHLALIDDVFKHAGLEIESVQDADNTELSRLYDVTGIKIKGTEENLSVILIGDKYVTSTGGERIQLQSPKISLVAGSIYKWYNELKEAIDIVLAEVEDYHNGKWDAVDVEPTDPNQLTIESQIEEEETA
jgi:hypothetical protein